MKKNNFKSFVPHIIAIVLFVVITMVYLSPLLEGKQLKQGDITNFQGVSKEIVNYRAATGKEALWTNRMFGGMPAYQISVVYKTNLINYIDRAIKWWLPHPAGLVFLYFLGFYILLLVLGVDKRLGIVGAIAFAFSSYFFIIIEAGHNSKANAIGYMAPVIAGIILTFNGRYWLGAALTTFFLALEINANHPQITYYLLLIIIVLGIAELVSKFKEKDLKKFFKAIGILVICLFLAAGANIASLWATYEYGKDSTRGKSELTSDKANKTTGLDKDYATDWSYGIAETWSLMIPNIKGGASGYIGEDKNVLKNVDPKYKEAIGGMNQYWGDQPFTSGPVYAGAIMVFLFALGLLFVKGKLKWWLLAGTIFSILLAWGKNFMGLTDLFLDYFPAYNKFRAVSMILVVAEVTIPLLAMLALKEIYEKPEILKEKKKQFFIAFGIVAGLLLLFWLLPSVFFNFTTDSEISGINTQMSDYLKQQPQNSGEIQAYFQSIIPNLEIARIAIFKADVIRSFIFILLSAGILWLYSIKKINKIILVIILAILITIDMGVINKRYLNDKNFTTKAKVKTPYLPTEADLMIMQDKNLDYRVYNLSVNTFNDASTSYFHNSIGGYHGAKLKRYQELIENQISKHNLNVLNMLNTRYFIIPDSSRNPVAQRNPNALGNAWFVDGYKLVANADSEIVALNNFNPASTAIIDKRFESIVSNYKNKKDSASVINLESYQPNNLVYKSKTTKDQLAVFSEIYYNKGWNVYIDGKPAEYFRTNYILRAMIIPAGEHKIEWKFEPVVYYTGIKASLAFNLLLIIAVLGFLFLEIKGKKQKT